MNQENKTKKEKCNKPILQYGGERKPCPNKLPCPMGYHSGENKKEKCNCSNPWNCSHSPPPKQDWEKELKSYMVDLIDEYFPKDNENNPERLSTTHRSEAMASHSLFFIKFKEVLSRQREEVIKEEEYTADIEKNNQWKKKFNDDFERKRIELLKLSELSQPKEKWFCECSEEADKGEHICSSPKSDWMEEFRKREFIRYYSDDEPKETIDENEKEAILFIQNLLTRQREELLKEILEKLPKQKVRQLKDFADKKIGKEYIEWSKGFNQAIQEIKSSLTKIKKGE